MAETVRGRTTTKVKIQMRQECELSRGKFEFPFIEVWRKGAIV
jgi:hypothetical protein